MISPSAFVSSALSAADLLDTFIDIAIDRLDLLTVEERAAVRKEMEGVVVQSAERAGCKAIMLYLLDHPE